MLIKKLVSLQGLMVAVFALVLSAGAVVDSAAATANKFDATQVGKSPRVAKAAKSGKAAKSTKATRPSKRAPRKVVFVPAQPSFGQAAGLHALGDELALKSSVALVIDQDTNEVLFSKNPGAVLPIASITKRMIGCSKAARTRRVRSCALDWLLLDKPVGST